MTTANATESQHFTWHCAVAALLMEFPHGAATGGHVSRAIRLATQTAVGKKGVRYASEQAMAIREAAGTAWDKCGLVKEHVIPNNLVHGYVAEELSRLASTQRLQGSIDTPVSQLGALLAEGDLARIRAFPKVQQVEVEWISVRRSRSRS